MYDEWVAVVQNELLFEVKAMSASLEKSHPAIHTQPVDILCCSAKDNEGVDTLADVIRDMLQDPFDAEEDWQLPPLPMTDDNF